MDKSKEELLIERYLNGKADKQEQAMLETWYLNDQEQGAVPDISSIKHAERKVWNKLSLNLSQPKKINLWPRSIAAASILLCVGLSLYFYKTSYTKKETKFDIGPGQNSATLQLSNGEKIDLSNTTNGKLIEETGITITKTGNGQIIYDLRSVSADTALNKMNTLSTARGQQYKVRLPDGTNVWLNAASSLSYPTAFKGRNRRVVELNGEAYFEVYKDKKHPFIVKTNQQSVEVLGTHFNINSYKDEPAVKTTLLEGSVKVLNLKSRASGILKPGQQSMIRFSGDSVQIETADVEEAMAWKKGEFYFDEERLESIMKKISRWYNVDVVFQDPTKKDVRIGGYISRFSNISKVLKMLELTGLAEFTLEKDKVLVK
ncbi:FecR family protein [Pedobacter nutrimenti]|uniref:FecR family protein n=1 Tax=Pedobacter nutrimenti TaxID=1241337 RepID=UPI0029308743|nr:FecR domain-containing protein [Pedobacter nutrimenti]